MSQTDDSQMSWPEYARTYGDEALRQYVDEQPEEVRLQLLTDPELAELYGRAGSQAEPAAPSESEAASPWWARGEPGLAPPPLGDTQMDPILYAREHGDQAMVDYVDNQPDELRQQLLEREDIIAEIYNRHRPQ